MREARDKRETQNDRSKALPASGRQETAPNRELLGWWYRFAAPPLPPADAPFALRERARRGRLASIILLGYTVLLLGALPIGFTDRATLYAIVISLLIALGAIFLNRRGAVSAAGLLLTLSSVAALLLVLLDAPHGRLDFIYLPLYDVFVVAELLAVSLLPPVSVFPVALLNSVIILADFYLQPGVARFEAIIGTPDGYSAVVRPILLQLIVAVVSYLWVSSSLNALRRADRAEELAELERREIERTRAMERGVREVLATHVQLANGNFNARVPRLDDPLLWQIGSSLNNLINRFARLAQAEFTLRRTVEEARRLGETLRALIEGRLPIWPAPSSTVVDDLLPPLQVLLTRGVNRPDAGAGTLPVAPGVYPPAQLSGGAAYGAPQIPAPGVGPYVAGGSAEPVGQFVDAGQPGQWGDPALDEQGAARDALQDGDAIDALEAQLPEWLRGPRSRFPQSAAPQPPQQTPLPRFGPQSPQSPQSPQNAPMYPYPYQDTPEYPTLDDDADSGAMRGDPPPQRDPYQ